MSKIFKGPASKVSIRKAMYFDAKFLAEKARQIANRWIRDRWAEFGNRWPNITDIKVTVKDAGEDGWAVVFNMCSDDVDVFGMVDHFKQLYEHVWNSILKVIREG